MHYLVSHAGRIITLTLEHVELVAASLIIALAIALPLGILAARNPRIGTPLIGILSIVYTIPSLALLALLVRWVGLGFATALIALTAYAQYVLVRTIATAVRGIAPAHLDAAKGLGFSPWQSFLRIELPLAMLGILAGIRVATVAMIAIATIAAYAGNENLGTLIFEGLAFKQPDRILAGSLCSMILALAVSGILRLTEMRIQRSTV